MRTSTPPLPRSLFAVIGSYHHHDTCRGCQMTAINAAATARVIGAMRGAYGDGKHQASVIRVFLPQPIPMPEPWTTVDAAMTPRHTCGGPHDDGATVLRTWQACPACQVADYDDAEEEATGRRRR